MEGFDDLAPGENVERELDRFIRRRELEVPEDRVGQEAANELEHY